jgi:membrane protein YqaA with SNARE-associated domain
MNPKNYKNKINALILKAKENAIKPMADRVLAFISLIESIIFPIPVDPLLAGLTLAAPQKSFSICVSLYFRISSWWDNRLASWFFDGHIYRKYFYANSLVH